MARKNNQKLILIVLAIVAVTIIFYVGVALLKDKNTPTNQTPEKEVIKDLEILGGVKLTYSDKWEITNKDTEGIEFSKGTTTILLTTSQIENGKDLNTIVDERNTAVSATKKIITDEQITINTIPFRKVSFGSIDEVTYPSDGLISYSTVVNNIYLNLIVNFPNGVNPIDAESLINTIRYN